jgi:hypothetical protein
LRLGRTIRFGETFAVHQVSPIAGQSGGLAGFELLRARLGVLSSEPSHTDHWLVAAVNQDQTHLQQDFQLVGDGIGGAIFKLLGAIAALQKKSLPLRGIGKLTF